MIYIDSQTTAFFDCDDTLIMHDNTKPYDLAISDPYEEGFIINCRVHQRHLKLLKDFKARGYVIVVWSAGGAPWAKAVVDALGIQAHVNLVMSKPLKYVDDLHADKILGSRIYLNEEGALEVDESN